jgi:hypothetical protein
VFRRDEYREGDTQPDTVGDTPTRSMGSGTVKFYMSDERNAIGDFEHLNVTVTVVSFHAADGGEDAEDETGTAETDPEEPTTPGPESTLESLTDAPESVADAEADEWVLREVNETAVDLTELQGDNATLLSRMTLPNGTHDRVRLHINDVNGTLAGSEQVIPKLSSERLRLDSRFTVGDGEGVDFVYDTTVFEAGNSGKYILKPIASESKTDVPIRAVDEPDDTSDGDEPRLDARFVGTVKRGANATIAVTSEGQSADDATVTVGDETYRTGEHGTVTVVPSDVAEVEFGGAETKLAWTLGDSAQSVADSADGPTERVGGDAESGSDDG